MNNPYFFSVVVLSCSVLVGIFSRAALTRASKKWHGRSLFAALLPALRTHALLWSVGIGIAICLKQISFPPRWEPFADRMSMALFILLLTVAAGHIGQELVPRIAQRFNVAIPAVSFSKNLVQIIVYLMGGLLLLSNLGVAIGPLLTALGVGSLAVGLALQDTLGNLFAGFYLLASRQVRTGDYVEVERGIGYGPRKGYVVDIGWRASRLKTLSGQSILVPNSFLTQSYIVSFQQESDLTVPVELQINADGDLAEIEERLNRVAASIFRRHSVPEPDRRLRLQFMSGKDPLVATALLRLPVGSDQGQLVHEFIKSTRAQFSREAVSA